MSKGRGWKGREERLIYRLMRSWERSIPHTKRANRFAKQNHRSKHPTLDRTVSLERPVSLEKEVNPSSHAHTPQSDTVPHPKHTLKEPKVYCLHQSQLHLMQHLKQVSEPSEWTIDRSPPPAKWASVLASERYPFISWSTWPVPH